MSDDKKQLRGREYLTAVRPETMGHLLAFFKGAGEHLQPKTRFLISVLKQVVNFSPRGLRQYIRRAMEAGASRDEIIDTILLAYPLANLTKMCDAVDVLLDMEAEAEAKAPAPAPVSIPAPAPAPAAAVAPIPPAAPPTASEPAWRALPGVVAPAEGTCLHASWGEKNLLIARRNGRLYAMNDQCPHRGGALHTGTLAEGAIVCPLHGWSFKLEDGSSAGRGMGGAKVYPVRESAGKVEVQI